MQDYRNIIEGLPEDDKPDFFGLPANIARSSQRIFSSQVKSHFSLTSESFLFSVESRKPSHPTTQAHKYEFKYGFPSVSSGI